MLLITTFYFIRVSRSRNPLRCHSIWVSPSRNSSSPSFPPGSLPESSPPPFPPGVSLPESSPPPFLWVSRSRHSSPPPFLRVSHSRISSPPPFLRVSHTRNPTRCHSTFSGCLTSGIQSSRRSTFFLHP